MLAHKGTNGGPPSGAAARVADEMARWSDEAHELMQVLGGWLEDAGRLQADVSALETERAALAEEVRRLREENDGLRGERDDLSDAAPDARGPGHPRRRRGPAPHQRAAMSADR